MDKQFIIMKPRVTTPLHALKAHLVSASTRVMMVAGLSGVWMAFTSHDATAAEPSPAAPVVEPAAVLRNLQTSEFPFDRAAAGTTAADWEKRRVQIRERILLACGLLPMPTRTPLNPVIYGRIEREDYTIDRVFFESFPGHFVTGNLYLPKTAPASGKMPGILCPHGHWPNGRFMDLGADTAETNQQLAIGAERWESGARSPLQARCVQLARMGCAVFFYDMLGYADSLQIADHRSGRRPGSELNGSEPGSYGLYSVAADLRLQSNFGLQIWNGLRALDFLIGLPGIDPTRIACTGASGGGTQTMMLAAIDARLAAAFPCVMVGTAMQGGCTCENACYLRIGQGNVDIAAAFAPKPMGMTAANDWTKELETKGFPDLKALWKRLGKPDNVMATFNIHWQHNYNHVSRTTMYGFMSKQLGLGFKEPVLERSFTVSSKDELTVWTNTHPAPSGEHTGPAHEKALLKHWSEDNDAQLKAHPEALRTAWSLILNRKLPASAELEIKQQTASADGAYVKALGIATDTSSGKGEAIPNDPAHQVSATLFSPPETKSGNNTRQLNPRIVVWLSATPPESPDEAMRKLLAQGYTVVIPHLCLTEAKQNPWNSVNTKTPDPDHLGWQWSACYTYGYNDPLLVKRAQQVLTVISALSHSPQLVSDRSIILAAGNSTGPIGALAATEAQPLLHHCVIDTEGFRFATLTDVQDVRFIPGAVKYGDLPGLLSLMPPQKLTILDEQGKEGGALRMAESVKF
ncbi:MAG: hypothetical protein QM796_21425 [Chthoniobacteraceae bacterium]